MCNTSRFWKYCLLTKKLGHMGHCTIDSILKKKPTHANTGACVSVCDCHVFSNVNKS